jgi:hypothetical protein
MSVKRSKLLVSFIITALILTFVESSVVDASSVGASCRKVGLVKGPSSKKLICKKIGKSKKWVRLGRTPGVLSTPLRAIYLGETSGIRLSWYYPYNSGSSSVTGYRLEFQTPKTPWLFASTLSSSQYEASVKDDRLAGERYRFRVAAINKVGVGVFAESDWVEYPTAAGGSAPTLTLPSSTNSSTSSTAPAKTSTTTTVSPGAVSQSNAVKKAASYLRSSAFSRSGLISQLEYEGFSLADATYGVDAQNADWNAQAVKKGASYLRTSAFSRSGLISQLEYEGFSAIQASYGTDAQNADWNAQAAKKAASYLKSSSFSRSSLIDQLLYEGFTQSQAEYGVSTTGL